MTTPLGVGNTVTYSNTGGIPTITSGLDLNDPKNFGWYAGSRVNLQDERRLNINKGLRGDLTWGDTDLNLKVGGAFDNTSRQIRGFDNSQYWQNAVCGNNPNVSIPSPNSQPPCEGLNAPGAAPAGYPTYPGYGTGFSSGMSGPVSYGGSLVPNSAAPSYLMPGPAGFVTVNWPAFQKATNYQFYHDNAPENGGANTGASAGFIREIVKSAFATLNGSQELGGKHAALQCRPAVRQHDPDDLGPCLAARSAQHHRERRHAARWQPLSEHHQHRHYAQRLFRMVARRDLRLRYRRPCGGACRRFAHDDAARSVGAAAWHQLRRALC